MVCSDRAGRIRHSRTWRRDQASPAEEYGYVDLFSWPIRRSDVCKRSTGKMLIGPTGKIPVPQWPLPRKNVHMEISLHPQLKLSLDGQDAHRPRQAGCLSSEETASERLDRFGLR